MFLRREKSGKYVYGQIVQNGRVKGKARQRVIGTLGQEVQNLEEEERG